MRVYEIASDTAGGMAAGEPHRTAAIPAEPAAEGKDAWQTAQGPSTPDAAGQTTGSASLIDSTGPNVSASPVTTAASTAPDLSEVAALLARGRSLLSNGDVVGARALLRKAAEHADLQAARALAETYDPVVLKHLGVKAAVNADSDLNR